ncbi:hypothetical protein M5K25_002034 [Dendrobium thyrsiflorum]|uniref:BED-type domain-containing protein n=1 Tax=Dendrobium thyrsiflorum TaxID=117978 RepID=A0ABD0W1W1_DENTH
MERSVSGSVRVRIVETRPAEGGAGERPVKGREVDWRLVLEAKLSGTGFGLMLWADRTRGEREQGKRARDSVVSECGKLGPRLLASASTRRRGEEAVACRTREGARRGNMVRGKEKSNASLRRDPSWKYSVQVDIGGAEKTYVYLKCNFCDKVVKGGVTRMKEHLSGSHKNVAPCANVPDKVKEEICAYMKKSITVKHLQQEQFDDRVEHGS